MPAIVVVSRAAARIASAPAIPGSIDRTSRAPTPSRATSSACMPNANGPLGWAYWSSLSQIALRMIAIEPAGRPTSAGSSANGSPPPRSTGPLDIDATAWRLVNARSRSACRRRSSIATRTRPGPTSSCRPCRRVRTGGSALLVDALVELFAPRGVLARNDPKVRRLEGLDAQVEVLHGEMPDRVAVREGAITCQVDLRQGQKTGAFLDQRENHQAAARYARGRVLDAFTYNGGFALQMAARADSVLALDSSAAAVAATARTRDGTGCRNIEAREVNVFDELRELESSGATFDVIVLDPPAFAKNKAAVERAAGRLQGNQPAGDAAARARRPSCHVQLFVQRRRGAVPRRPAETPRSTRAGR